MSLNVIEDGRQWPGAEVQTNRYRVTQSLEKKIKLQEELIGAIRKALPEVKDREACRGMPLI